MNRHTATVVGGPEAFELADETDASGSDTSSYIKGEYTCTATKNPNHTTCAAGFGGLEDWDTEELGGSSGVAAISTFFCAAYAS